MLSQMLHLVCSSSFTSPALVIGSSSISITTNLKYSIFLRVNSNTNNPSASWRRRSMRNGAKDNDSSDFEVDADKAREALRQLDQQFKSLSEKKITPPKIRAVDLDQDYPWSNQEPADVSGSFLTILASALLVFTIVYNVIFATVIKPSIDKDDQEEPVPALNVTKDTQDGVSIESSVTTPRIPVGL